MNIFSELPGSGQGQHWLSAHAHLPLELVEAASLLGYLAMRDTDEQDVPAIASLRVKLGTDFYLGTVLMELALRGQVEQASDWSGADVAGRLASYSADHEEACTGAVAMESLAPRTDFRQASSIHKTANKKQAVPTGPYGRAWEYVESKVPKRTINGKRGTPTR